MFIQKILKNHLSSIQTSAGTCDICSGHGIGKNYYFGYGHRHISYSSSLKDLGLVEHVHSQQKPLGQSSLFLCSNCMTKILSSTFKNFIYMCLPFFVLLLFLLITKKWTFSFNNSFQMSILSLFSVLMSIIGIWGGYTEYKMLFSNKKIKEREKTLAGFVVSHPKAQELRNLYPPPRDWSFYTIPILDD